MTQELLLSELDRDGQYIQPTESALSQKRAAIETAQEITAVDSPESLADAVAAMSIIKDLVKKMEATRVQLKEPFLTAGKTIDAVAKGYSDTLEQECKRVQKLTNAYQTALEAARQAENDRLLAEQRAAQENPDTTDSMRERVMLANQLMAKPVVAGARTSQDIQIEVTDALALAVAMPGMVRIEPRLAELKGWFRQPNAKDIPGVRVTYGVKVDARI